MEKIIETDRLILTRLTDTTLEGRDVQWFHENWSDTDATAWSLHGPTKSLEESRDWMIEHLTKYDNQFYAIHLKTPQSQYNVNLSETNQTTDKDDDDEREKRLSGRRGAMVGSVSLRLMSTGPELPPAPLSSVFSPARPSSSKVPLRQLADEEAKLMARQPVPSSTHPSLPQLNPPHRSIGYAFFPQFWGKGYASEAGAGLLEAYQSFREKKELGKQWYVEAQIDRDNAASGKVVQRLGFRFSGWKEDEGKAWLAGAWREQVFGVWGVWV